MTVLYFLAFILWFSFFVGSIVAIRLDPTFRIPVGWSLIAFALTASTNFFFAFLKVIQ